MCSLRQTVSRSRAEATAQRLRCCKTRFDSEEILKDKRQLRDRAKWHARPHECPCLVAELSVLEACAGIGAGRTREHAHAWQERHVGVLERRPAGLVEHFRAPPKKAKICLFENMCFCGRERRGYIHFWACARRALSRRFNLEEEKDLLNAGCICLAFRGKAGDVADDAPCREHVLVHIPYHCGNPWRPAFLVLCVVPEEAPLILAHHPEDQQAEDTYITFGPAHNQVGEPEFKSPLQLLSDRIDLELKWEVSVLHLSQRPQVMLQAAGYARARFCKEPPLQCWLGAEAEARRIARAGGGAGEEAPEADPEALDNEGMEAALHDDGDDGNDPVRADDELLEELI